MELPRSREMMYEAMNYRDGSTKYKSETYEYTIDYLCNLIELSTSKGYTYCMPRIFFYDWELEKRIYIELIKKGYNVCKGLAGELYFISWEDADKYAHISDEILKEAGIKEGKDDY